MKTVSRDYMLYMLKKDLNDVKDIRITVDGIAKMEVNNHTYEMTGWGVVIACFDGLNYSKCDSHIFTEIYKQIVNK